MSKLSARRVATHFIIDGVVYGPFDIDSISAPTSEGKQLAQANWIEIEWTGAKEQKLFALLEGVAESEKLIEGAFVLPSGATPVMRFQCYAKRIGVVDLHNKKAVCRARLVIFGEVLFLEKL
jgi:hypothetical protein